ncbi:MAG TPA: hypothetical protein VK760_15365, partial [Candidatus Acidoferrales bacterium]|nr:hypothetical protein [Candidatus Acidoferrales bacterium]
MFAIAVRIMSVSVYCFSRSPNTLLPIDAFMRKTVVHAVLCLFALFVAGAAAAASPEPTPTPVPPPHLDTILDINASTIVASLVGCDAKKGDKVLVNGQPQDNAHWDLRSLTPSEEKPL